MKHQLGMSFFFDHALLAGGWARDVRIVVERGLIAGIVLRAFPSGHDERHAYVLPGPPISTAMPFSAAWPDLRNGVAPPATASGPSGTRCTAPWSA